MPDTAPIPESEDSRIAEKLGISPDTVFRVRENFYLSQDGAIVLSIFQDRIQKAISEQQNKLESINTVDELKLCQGQLKSLRRALALINQKT